MYPGPSGQQQSQQQFDPRTGQPNALQSHGGMQQFNPSQMQTFNGYNNQMPPPGTTMQHQQQQANQQYQGHIRTNSAQMPPSPGYAQSPTTYNTQVPGQIGQQFYQPQVPPSQPMASGSPQVTNNPLQQKPAMTGQGGEVSKLDATRIDLLLEYNKILFAEIVQLQEAGKGLATDIQTGQQSPTASVADGENNAAKKGPAPSREYMECMMRLRGNFTYLTPLAATNPSKVIARPPILEPLTQTELVSSEVQDSIKEMCRKLKELFPPLQTQQSPQQTPQGLTAQQQQAQNMQQQILQHQQQMAGNMQMNNSMMQQQAMMQRAMAMQNQQGTMNPGM